MVPRLLAAARAMRSRTCADVIQHCRNDQGRKRRETLGTRLRNTAVKRLSMREKLQEHRTAFVLGKYQISVA